MIPISDQRLGNAKKEFRDDFLNAFYIDFVQGLSPSMSDKSLGRRTSHNIKVRPWTECIYYVESIIFASPARGFGTQNLQSAKEEKNLQKCGRSLFLGRILSAYRGKQMYHYYYRYFCISSQIILS